VGRALTLANAAANPAGTALYGGATSYSFGYDNLYELTSASSSFLKPNMPTQGFTLAMAYDGIHNITHKTQTAFNQLSNGTKTPNLPLTYDWAYTYGGGRPHAASQIGDPAFLYDLNGNQAGWNATDSAQLDKRWGVRFAAQYLARVLPCERFTPALADRTSCITRGRGGWLGLTP